MAAVMVVRTAAVAAATADTARNLNRQSTAPLVRGRAISGRYRWRKFGRTDARLKLIQSRSVSRQEAANNVFDSSYHMVHLASGLELADAVECAI